MGVGILSTRPAQASVELSGSAAYYHQQFDQNSGYALSRRWTAGLAVRATLTASIEFFYGTAYTEFGASGFRSTSIGDQLAALNWIQALFPESTRFAPFLKAGIGWLSRSASQLDSTTNTSVQASLQSLSAVLGAGLAIRIVDPFAIKIEATTYLPGGNLQTAKDNYSMTFGVSLRL